MKIFYHMMRFTLIVVAAPIIIWFFLTLAPIIIASLFSTPKLPEYESQALAFSFATFFCLAPGAVIALPITIIVMLYLKGVFKEK